MPTNAGELLELSRSYAMECSEREDGLRQVQMHIGESTFPVLLGHNKLPQLVAQLKSLDFDKVCAAAVAHRACCVWEARERRMCRHLGCSVDSANLLARQSVGASICWRNSAAMRGAQRAPVRRFSVVCSRALRWYAT